MEQNQLWTINIRTRECHYVSMTLYLAPCLSPSFPSNLLLPLPITDVGITSLCFDSALTRSEISRMMAIELCS